jgi:glycerol-3-phosphate O-acyltransferase/dihydroxyacetone phosphate acyltransferase
VTRWAVTALLRLILRVFFRRIEVAGAERVPASGPVIYVLNHPNALLDPVLILCRSRRPVSFLAKEPIFRMFFVGWIARSIDSLPVYRAQDAHDPAKNRATFEAARALLARGGTIAIFPEGTTHSDPALRRVKSGAARIALGADLDGVMIVPVGLYYTAKEIFRSSALVFFGKPFEVARTAPGPDGEPPAGAVRALSERIERALRDVTLNADGHEALALVARAERIFAAGEADAALAAELERRRLFLDGRARHRERSPERAAALEARIEKLAAGLAEAGLSPEDLAAPARRARATLGHAAAAALLAPAGLPGAVAHWPAYRLAGALAARVAKDDDTVVSTAKVLAAMLLFPLTWIAVAAAAGLAEGWRAGLAALLAAPCAGYAAILFNEQVEALRGCARALASLLVRRGTVERLAAERRAIREEILALGRELEIAPDA